MIGTKYYILTTESGKVIDSAHIATDIFPTVLEACGGNAEDYELDGKSILTELSGGEEQTHEYLFWELEDQTAVRYGKYKLVINGHVSWVGKVVFNPIRNKVISECLAVCGT